jgi:hypothetical protein
MTTLKDRLDIIIEENKAEIMTYVVGELKALGRIIKNINCPECNSQKEPKTVRLYIQNIEDIETLFGKYITENHPKIRQLLSEYEYHEIGQKLLEKAKEDNIIIIRENNIYMKETNKITKRLEEKYGIKSSYANTRIKEIIEREGEKIKDTIWNYLWYVP